MTLNSNFNLRRITVLIAGTWFYRFQEQVMRRKVADDLTAIGRLKADQISAWCSTDQVQDAAVIQTLPSIIKRVERLLADYSEANVRQLHDHLQDMADQHDFTDILLVDPEGRTTSPSAPSF